MMRTNWTILVLAMSALACGDDDDHGTEADRLLVGAECTSDDDCLSDEEDGGFSEKCLTQFKGGYCGVEDCEADDDCPERSACVLHDDGRNYCFRLCVEKDECNANRTDESALNNCSSSVEYVDGTKEELGKACLPPSGE